MDEPYTCGECDEPVRVALATIPYPESGLDNVVLANVPVRRCSNGHEDVQIPAIKELHDVLATVVISQPWPLLGQHVRFLRKHLGYSARSFSAIIGLNYVTLSKFEDERSRISRKVDALVRLFCAQAISERLNQRLPKPLIPVLERLESESTLDLRDLRLEHVEIGGNGAVEPRHLWQEATV